MDLRDTFWRKKAKYLIPETFWIPIIYSVPKIHKDKDDPPPRPIVNGIESIATRMGQYIDNFLQPVVQNTKAYLKDTKHIQLLEDIKVEEEPLFMATGDVSSLCTIIHHHQACKATKWVHRQYTTLLCTQRKYLIKCLDFCLKNNYFWYHHKFYQQKMGVAMGAKFAPSVANLCMVQ